MRDFPLTDFMHEMADFADTAVIIANLDLVISVDSAVAHLAAALARTLPYFGNTGKTGGTQVQHWPVRNESHGNPPLFLDFKRRTMRVRFVSAPGFAGITYFERKVLN
jgi:hypothetical protein